MLFLPRLALAPLLLAAPVLCHAQAAPTGAAAAPRFYVGLGAYNSFYQPLESRRAGITGFPIPLQLTAGYQLRPRLNVQVGLAYSSSAYDYQGMGYFYDLNSPHNTYYAYSGSSSIRTASASLLARYTLTGKAAHRMQFDALGGLTLEFRRGADRGTYTDSLGGSRNVSPYDTRKADQALLLTAGLGTRYRLSSRVDLTLDLLLNHSLTTPIYTTPRLGLTGSSALSLRFRFGK